MPTYNIEDDLYRIYDLAIAKTIEVFATNPSCQNTIRLSGLDRKNKEHLFVLRLALMVRDLYQTPIELAVPWWDGMVINWKIRKGFKKVKIVNRFKPNCIWVPSLVGKVKSEVRAETDLIIPLDDIYDTYYERSCG